MNVDGDNGEGAATAGFGRPNRGSHRAALSSDGMVGLRRSSIKSQSAKHALVFSLSSLAVHRDLLPSWYYPNARLERINQTATSANI
jgi:hypothetical protein